MKKCILILLAVFFLAGCSNSLDPKEQVAIREETVNYWENLREEMEGRIEDFDKLNLALNSQSDICKSNGQQCYVYLGEEFNEVTNEGSYIEPREDEVFIAYGFAYGPGGASGAIFRKPTTESAEYTLVFEGQSSPSCGLVEELKISTVVSANCEREDGNLFDRVKNEVVKFD